MENYKDKLKIQNISFTICAVILALFIIFLLISNSGLIPAPETTVGDDRWDDLWNGFTIGAATSILGFMILGLIRNTKALKSEKALKKLYVNAHDERTIQVWTSARAAAYQICLMLGIVAAVVSGYFSMTVSITIMACVVAASLLGLAFKLYYNNKY